MSLAEIRQICLNRVYSKLWPGCALSVCGFDDVFSTVLRKSLTLASHAEFDLDEDEDLKQLKSTKPMKKPVKSMKSKNEC